MLLIFFLLWFSLLFKLHCILFTAVYKQDKHLSLQSQWHRCCKWKVVYCVCLNTNSTGEVISVGFRNEIRSVYDGNSWFVLLIPVFRLAADTHTHDLPHAHHSLSWHFVNAPIPQKAQPRLESPRYECVSDFLLSCLCCHNFSRLIQYVYVHVCLTFLWIVASSLVWTRQLLIMINLTRMPQRAVSSQTPMHLGWTSPFSHKMSLRISE